MSNHERDQGNVLNHLIRNQEKDKNQVHVKKIILNLENDYASKIISHFQKIKYVERKLLKKVVKKEALQNQEEKYGLVKFKKKIDLLKRFVMF